jgi:hypothetical protein
MEGNERFDKEHVEHGNPSFTILDNRLESLEFMSINVPLTPHHIGIGEEVIIISSTLHALEVFTTPITTFEDTLDRWKITTPTGLKL